MQPHLPLRLRGPDSGSGGGSHIAIPMHGERHYVPSYNSESLHSRRVGLGLHHLISFCSLNPKKGHCYPHFTDERLGCCDLPVIGDCMHQY